MKHFYKISILLIILLCISCFVNIPINLYASNDNINTQNIIKQETTKVSSPIAKDSNTYKILVGLTIVSVLIIIIAMRSMIINICAYLFVISSILWTIYSILPLFKKEVLEFIDFLPVFLGTFLIVISCVILHLINGNSINWSSMKSDNSSDNAMSSKEEYDLLIKRARLAFITLKQEMSQGKFDKTAVFTDDNLYEQLCINLDATKSENYLLHYDDLKIKKITLKNKKIENHMNNSYIEIIADSIRYKTDIKTKNIIKGSEISGEFTEIFCFSRKAGCKIATKGLIEGCCPLCKKPIKGERETNCSQCKRVLRSGDFDIILTSISYPD